MAHGNGDASVPTKTRIPVSINQERYRLEVIEEAPRGAPPAHGWPLALITHGAPGTSNPAYIGPNLLLHWVSYADLRHRLRSCLDEPLYPVVDAYLAQPAHRVLAVSTRRDWLFWNSDVLALESARFESLMRCKLVTDNECHVLAWDASLSDEHCVDSRQR